LEAGDVSDIAGASAFPIFQNNVREGKPVKVVVAPGLHRRRDDPSQLLTGEGLKRLMKELEDTAKTVGAKGLAYMALPLEETGEVKGPIGKFFSVEQKLELFERTGAKPGDILMFVSDKREIVWASVDKLRRTVADILNLADPDVLDFAWIIDFPMFYWDEENKRWDPSQHMFTMPMPEDVHYLDTDPGKARGSQYDLVCNGYEIGGGSIRIHSRELQEKDRKSTRLNSSHVKISYAVFCLK